MARIDGDSGLLNPPRGRACRNAGLHSSISRTCVIQHPPGQHDDLANAVAGALLLARPRASVEPDIGSPIQVNAGPTFYGHDWDDVPMAERPLAPRDWGGGADFF